MLKKDVTGAKGNENTKLSTMKKNINLEQMEYSYYLLLFDEKLLELAL